MQPFFTCPVQQIILKIYGLFGLPIPSCVIPIVGEPLPVEAVRLGGVGGHVAHRRGGLVAFPRVLAAVHHAVPLRVEVVLRLRYKMCLLTTLDLTRKVARYQSCIWKSTSLELFWV